MKVRPFISSVCVMGGLWSLGLPGLSGFVAEMTVFMGAWQNADDFYRIATIIACASIVVTAVYILRAIGKAIMGPLTPALSINGEGVADLLDAQWNEKWAAGLLIIGIIAIGIAPFWLNQLIGPGTDTIMKNIDKISLLK